LKINQATADHQPPHRIINRRIEEASRPIPKVLKLGSLKELCREPGIAETG
jgi:hypothetical protein